MNTFLLLTAILGAQPTLTLWPNSTEIKQCDHLVTKTVLLNSTDHDITVDRDFGTGNFFHLQRKLGGKWVYVEPMSTYWGVGRRMYGPDPIIKANAKFATYDTIHLRRQKGEEFFVFDEPGEYELRVYKWLSGDSIVSQPVKITVRARNAAELDRIRKLEKGNFGILGTKHLDYSPFKGLRELGDVGGNLGAGIRHLEMMERILSGEEKTGDDVFKYIRDRMDPINAQVAFHILGYKYRTARDFSNLEKVVNQLPDKSAVVVGWEGAIAYERLQVIPRVVVPSKP